MNQFRHQQEDAPGLLGAVLATEDPLDNEQRLAWYRHAMRQFYRARMEPVAPNLFPCNRREYRRA